MESYLSITENKVFTSEILVNKSRFLGFAKHIENQAEAEAFLQELRLKFKDARHICYAYVLGNLAKASDDGEPSGTAGKPILSVLGKKSLINIIVVVVRYFGGIKLGAGGLLRAYTTTANDALNNSQICEWFSSKICTINFDYKDYETFLKSIKGRNIIILETNFENGATVKFVARDDENIDKAQILCKTMQHF